MLTPWKESYDQPRWHFEKQRHYFANKGLSSQGYGFSSGHEWVRVGLWRKLSAEELMLLKCGVGGLLRVPWTARRSNQSILKEISPGYSLEYPGCWSWISNILATWCEELTHLKRPWCWERLKAGGKGDNRGWDGWMASLTRWRWVWASSGSWWWTGKPGVLQSMGSQTVRHDWVTELNWRQITGKHYIK